MARMASRVFVGGSYLLRSPSQVPFFANFFGRGRVPLLKETTEKKKTGTLVLTSKTGGPRLAGAMSRE